MSIHEQTAAPAAPQPDASRARSGLAIRLHRDSGILYLAPATIILFAVTIIPFCYLMFNSFMQWDLRKAYLGKTFNGLENYTSMLSDQLFLASIQVTVLAVAGVVFSQITLGMLLALLFSREFYGKRVLRSLFLLPLITTPVVVGLTWRMLYNSDLGMISFLLAMVGISAPAWLADPNTALLSVIITDTWHATPFVTLMFVAGIQSLPTEPYEAAKVDGASAWQRFLYITLPILRPLIFLALIFRVTDALRMFDIIYVMTGGGPANMTQTLNMYAFKVGFTFLNMGYGSAMAVVLMVVCIAASFILVKYSGLELGADR